MKESKFDKLLKFRSKIVKDLIKGKIEPSLWGDKTYMFIQQNKIKYIKKCHDNIQDLILNYLFWTAKIERAISRERKLEPFNTNSPELLQDNILFELTRKRDRMMKRIILECDVKIKSAYIVHDNIVEIMLEGLDSPFYCSREELEKVKISVKKTRNTQFPYYLPYIVYE